MANSGTQPKTSLTRQDIAQMLDLSAVKAEQGPDHVENLASVARILNCKAVFVLPCYTAMLRTMLDDAPEIIVGGAVGFPSGASTSGIKVAETRELIANGVGEIDMVACIGMIKQGRDQYVIDDIKAVVDAAEGLPVKVIIEAHYLTDDEICNAARLAVAAGARFVKTGTGWAPTGATIDNITLIKKTVGDACEVKAAGGVRDLETLVQMYRRGATRFGVNAQTGIALMEQLDVLPENTIEVGKIS